MDSCHSEVHQSVESCHYLERGLDIRKGRMKRGLARLYVANASHRAACTYNFHAPDMTGLIPCIVILIASVEDLKSKQGEGL